MPLHVSSKCAHHQEVKIALYSLWYHHTETLVSVWRYQLLYNTILTSWWWAHVLETCRGMKQSYCKTKFCASSWLITEITKFLKYEIFLILFKILNGKFCRCFFLHVSFLSPHKTPLHQNLLIERLFICIKHLVMAVQFNSFYSSCSPVVSAFFKVP